MGGEGKIEAGRWDRLGGDGERRQFGGAIYWLSYAFCSLKKGFLERKKLEEKENENVFMRERTEEKDKKEEEKIWEHYIYIYIWNRNSTKKANTFKRFKRIKQFTIQFGNEWYFCGVCLCTQIPHMADTSVKFSTE